jgi:hypothetical protein
VAPQTATSPAAPAAVKDTAQKGAAPAKPAASLQKKKTVEEDIISEDEEMLIPEKGVPQPVKKQQPLPAKPDTSAASAQVKTAADTSKAAPAAAGEPARTSAAPLADTSIKAVVAPAPAAPAKPAKIEEARAINFARNLKEFRSPKLAMLLSLCIPGLGQAYIKSYVRAGLYIAAEAAIIGISVLYMNKGQDKYNQARTFADKNFSGKKMVNYYNDLDTFIINKIGGTPATAQEALDNIYVDSLKSFAHACSTKSQDFYRTIEDKAFTQGWNDCEPTLAEIGSAPSPGLQLTGLPPGYQNRYYRYDTLGLSYLVNIKNKDNDAFIPDGQLQYGYSLDQRAFRTLMSQSNDNFKTATNVAFVLIVNHVVSAVDALISANIYNSEMLGKQTFWRHIEVEPGVAGLDPINAPGLTMRIKF